MAMLCLAPLAAGAAANAATIAFTPLMAAQENVTIKGGFLVLQQRPPDNLPYLQMEAESATLAFAAGGGFVPVEGGGVAATRCRQVSFDWTPPAAGDYRLWYRARFPFKGSWMHTETVAGRPLPVNDSARVGDDEWGSWLWLPGNVWELPADPTSFSFDWQGGVELDRLVVVNADWPLARVAALSRPEPAVASGWVMTRWIEPDHFDQWVDLADSLRPWPGVTYEAARRDAPDAWEPFDPGNPPLGAFRLRLRFVASAANPAPATPLPALRYRPRPEGLFAVATPRGRAVFSRSAGNLLLLTGINGQELYRATATVTEPFLVDICEGEGRNRRYARSLPLANPVFGEENGIGVWRFDLGEGFTARLEAGPGPADTIAMGLSLSRADDASSPATIRAQFPLLNGFFTGDDVSMFVPHFTGQVVSGLGQAPYTSVSRLTYPGDMGSQWVTVAEKDRGGVAFGAFDPDLRQVHYLLNVERAGAPLALRRQFARRLEAGETWPLTPLLLSPFTGDWRDGARPYRQWFLERFPQPPPDLYVDYNQGFLNASIMDVGLSDYSLMPWQLDIARQNNLRFTLWWAQGADIMGACPVQYPASPPMGGADLLKEMNRSLKENGFTAGYYMNVKLYTRTVVAGGDWMNAQPMAELEPAATRPPLILTKDEVKALEVQPLEGGGSAYAFWSDMAINEPRWQEYLLAWVEHYWREYGGNHVYLDQFNHSPHDWLNNPPDGSVGHYMDGQIKLAHALHDLAKKYPGRHAFTGECFGELTARLYGQGLWASTRDAGSAPGGYQLGKGSVQGPDYGRFLVPWGLWHEYFPGDRASFNGFLYNLPNTGLEEQARQLRREFNLLGSGARYQDTLGLVRVPAGLRARTYQGWPEAGRFEFVALTVPEPGGSPLGGELAFTPQTLKKVDSAWLFTPGESRPLEFVIDEAGAVTVELPPVTLAYVLLVDSLPARLRLDNLPWETKPGTRLATKATLFRWTAANHEASAVLDVNGHRREIRLPAGGGPAAIPLEVKIDLPAKMDFDNLAEFRQVQADSRPPVTLGYVSGRPLVRQRLHVSYADQEAVLWLENPSERRQNYAIGLDLPPELGWRKPPPAAVALEPGETRELRLPLASVRELTDRVWITGTIKVRGLRNWRERTHLLKASAQPPIFDAGFENCIGQDGKYGFSTFWHRFHAYIPQDVPLAFQGIYPDRERVHGGRQSLRFDARRNTPNPRLISLFGRAEPGRRYRLSAWFYREHAEDGLALNCASPAMHGALTVQIDKADPVGEWFRKEAVMTKPTVPEKDVPGPFVRFHTNLWPTNPEQRGAVWIDDVEMTLIDEQKVE